MDNIKEKLEPAKQFVKKLAEKCVAKEQEIVDELVKDEKQTKDTAENIIESKVKVEEKVLDKKEVNVEQEVEQKIEQKVGQEEVKEEQKLEGAEEVLSRHALLWKKIKRILNRDLIPASWTSKKAFKFDVVDEDFSDTDGFSSSLKIGHFILWMSILFVVIMLFWASFADLEEVTVAHGQVVSSSKTQIIQSLEGGIVKDILVKEGQGVKQNQIVARMNDVGFSSNMREGEVKEIAYSIRVARINAELHNKPFHVNETIAKKYPSLVSDAKALYESRKNELANLHNMKSLVSRELKMTEPLVEHGAVSEVEILRLKQRESEIDASISRFHTQALQELNAARSESKRLSESNVALKDRLERTDLRSPMNGIIKQIYVSTIGGVVSPGSPIMEIVPLEDSLLIEARVRPQDIGFLQVGQQAIIKLSAYDFSIYGGLKGVVTYISADTSVDKKGNSFYEIRVRTNKNYLQKNNRKLQIMSGMQVSVDIVTGKKTVLDYLLKPILKTKQQALRER